MTSFFISFLLMPLASCLAGWGQQRPETPTPRATTTLIEFTIVALDGKGNPVSDLKKEAISITENGRPREVAYFRFEGGGTEKTPPLEPLPPGVFTNRPEQTPGPTRNLIAIVMDMINTSPADQMLAQAQMTRYLQALPHNTRAAMFRMGDQISVAHDFTDDIESLRPHTEAEVRASMAAAEARALSAFNEGLRDIRLATTLSGLEALGDHLAGVPGRKNLVWITSGMGIHLSAARDGQFPKNYGLFMRRTAQRLASQGIAIYPVDAKGLMRASEGPRTQGGTGHNDAQSRVFGLLDEMAEVSGGRVVKSTNDPTQGVSVAAADQCGAYTIGFYAPDEPDDEWHNLKAKVGRPGVKVLHRQGYLWKVPAERPQDWSAREWRAAAGNLLGSTAIRLDARSELASGTLSVILQLASEDLYFRTIDNHPVTELDVAIAELTPKGWSRIRDEKGSVRLPEEQAKEIKRTAVRFGKSWPIGPETSVIRLIVRDRLTGRHGTLDLPVKQIPSKDK